MSFKSSSWSYSYFESVRRIGGAASSKYQQSSGVGVVMPSTGHRSVISPDTPGSTGQCNGEGSSSVYLCSTMNYDYYVCTQQIRCINVLSFVQTSSNLDPHDVVLTGTYSIQGVVGRCHLGCALGSYYNGTHNFGSHVPASGVNYTYTGYWKGSYCEVYVRIAEFQGVNSYLSWNYRGRAQPAVNNDEVLAS